MKSIRLEATKTIWVAFGFATVALFISAGMSDGIHVEHVILGAVIAIAAFLGTGMVWNWGDANLERETFLDLESDSHNHDKRKNKARKLDLLLERLSDEELLDLREELMEAKVRGINDEGELVYEERRR